MSASHRQADLFEPDRKAAEADAARVRMRQMIERLRCTETPPWANQMAVILDDGSFKRAMWAVPTDEGAALWAEYDVQAERLYAIWAAAQPA